MMPPDQDRPKQLFKYSKTVGNITTSTYVSVSGPLKKLNELPDEHLAVEICISTAKLIHENFMPRIEAVLHPKPAQKQEAAP